MSKNERYDGDEQGKPGTEYSDSPEAYWARKQTPSKNRVIGDADSPLVRQDRDTESDNYSFGQKGYPGSAGQKGSKSSSIWDDEAWKDKD